MAAAEALWHTENPASFSIFTIGDPKNFKDIFAIKVPYIESFMSYNSFNHPVQGISELQAQYVKEYGPGNYVPPVVVTYWAFRFMLGVAGAMAVLASAGLFLLWKKRLESNRRFLGLLITGIFIPYIGNTAGWVLTEIGRQPWLVFGQLKTDAGVSLGASPTMILFTLITFLVLYGIFAVVEVYLLGKMARRGILSVEDAKASEQQDDLASLVYYVEPELRRYNVGASQGCDAPGTELPAHHSSGAGMGFRVFPKVMLPSLNNASIHHRTFRDYVSESPASGCGSSLKKVSLLAYGQENAPSRIERIVGGELDSTRSQYVFNLLTPTSFKDVSPGTH
jgi:hypothetical protein